MYLFIYEILGPTLNLCALSGPKHDNVFRSPSAQVDDIQPDSAGPANHHGDAPSKGSVKKQKNEMDKGE